MHSCYDNCALTLCYLRIFSNIMIHSCSYTAPMHCIRYSYTREIEFLHFLLQFLGDIEVDQPKGIEVVKQGIQKLKFNQQLKKSEGSNKTPKAELTISVDGVTIQEPKTKKVLHEYPLQRISYCADDKAEKRFFSFIAKDADSTRHTCFVFVSDKLVSSSIHHDRPVVQ
jgi:hypothetical protein